MCSSDLAGRAARRHDIQITLRRNPYGGTTAIVLIPHSIVVAEGFAELEPARALEGGPAEPARRGPREQHGFPPGEDIEATLTHEGMPGALADAGGPARQEPGLPSYHAAPPAAAPPAPEVSPARVPPWAEARHPPMAEPGPAAQTQAEAESRAWAGLESPAWSAPPPATAGASSWDEMAPPVLPRRVRQASLVPQLRNAPPAYPPLPGRYGDPRSPEDARSTVSAIQHGSERGRSMFDPAAGQASGSGAPQGGESGAGHDEAGQYGAYQQETPAEDRGPYGPA